MHLLDRPRPVAAINPVVWRHTGSSNHAKTSSLFAVPALSVFWNQLRALNICLAHSLPRDFMTVALLRPRGFNVGFSFPGSGAPLLA